MAVIHPPRGSNTHSEGQYWHWWLAASTNAIDFVCELLDHPKQHSAVHHHCILSSRILSMSKNFMFKNKTQIKVINCKYIFSRSLFYNLLLPIIYLGFQHPGLMVQDCFSFIWSWYGLPHTELSRADRQNNLWDFPSLHKLKNTINDQLEIHLMTHLES